MRTDGQTGGYDKDNRSVSLFIRARLKWTSVSPIKVELVMGLPLDRTVTQRKQTLVVTLLACILVVEGSNLGLDSILKFPWLSWVTPDKCRDSRPN
jgi:hypothetical protein